MYFDKICQAKLISLPYFRIYVYFIYFISHKCLKGRICTETFEIFEMS